MGLVVWFDFVFLAKFGVGGRRPQTWVPHTFSRSCLLRYTAPEACVGESAHCYTRKVLDRLNDRPCAMNSVDHLLQALHWEGFHGLGGWLRLEDARLFREGVHTFAR